MLETIEKLLVLQERDRQLLHLEMELETIDPKRRSLEEEARAASSGAEATRKRGMELESERKRLELEVEGKQELVRRYSLQQYETKRNEEYRALSKEIDTCKAQIVQLEDRELEIMEQAEAMRQQARQAAGEAVAKKSEVEKQLAALAEREAGLKARRSELIGGREALASGVDGDLLPFYEKLRRSKRERMVVGVTRGICGGCHMQLPAQIVLTCRVEKEIVTCQNCGRILYFAEG